MATVYLSSTFRDLAAHRQAVVSGLRALPAVQVEAMEDWALYPDQPQELCLQKVERCSIFVLIAGMLHGYVPPGDAHSITQSEYETAVRHRKRILAFLAPDDLEVPANLLRSERHLDLQDAFRARVLRDEAVDQKWRTPDQLATGVVTAVGSQLSLGAASDAATVPDLDLAAYVERCQRRWSLVDLTALAAAGTLDEDTERLSLRQIFIPQDCRRTRPAVSLPRDYLESQGLESAPDLATEEEARQRWEREKRIPALDFIGRPEARELVLLGDPGAGKSSLARHLVLELLQPAPPEAPPWRTALRGLLPFLVEVRDFVARRTEKHCDDLLSYLGYVGEREGFGFDGDVVERQFATRPCLLVIDGLDEVFSVSERKELVEEIIGLPVRFRQLRVLVTSRIVGFDAGQFERAGFQLATLDDLSRDQIEYFARVWFDLAFLGQPGRAMEARDDLLRSVARSPQLASIAGNPLILTIMAIVARYKRLARSRAQLYGQAMEVLAYAWDYRRGLRLASDSPLSELQAEDTLAMLRMIAWDMQEKREDLRANAVGELELRGLLERYFENEWRFERLRSHRASSEMLTLLQERSWVLTLRGPGLFGFVHRTFLEYLCASELARRFSTQSATIEELCTDFVGPRIEDDSWREVIRLLCGQLPAAAARQLIHHVLTKTEDPTTRLLLGWRLLTEIDPRQLHGLRVECQIATDHLFAFLEEGYDGSNETTLDLISSISSLDADYWPAPGPSQRGYPVPSPSLRWTYPNLILVASRDLWNDASGGFEQIASRARSDDNEYVRASSTAALAEQLGAGELAGDVFSMLVELVHDPHGWVRSTAVEALGRHFGRRPEAFGVLSEQLVEDPEDKVRAAAAEALATGFASRGETFELVCRRLDVEQEGAARAGLVRALASGFASRGETFELLCRRLTTEQEGYVRATVAEALATGFAGREQTFELLCERLEVEQDGAARAGLVRGLGTGFADRPDTLALLRTCAAEDPDAAVRRAAATAWSRAAGGRRERVVLSKDLDGLDPGWDARDIVDRSRVSAAAGRLLVPEDEVRSVYNMLVETHGFPLRLEWRAPR